MYISSSTPESWFRDWPNWYIVEIRRNVDFFYNTMRVSIGRSGWFDVKKQKTELELSFSAEVITGWRAWRITDFKRRGGVFEKRLQALGTSPVWEPYQAGVAICTTDGTHEVPWPDCKCGFWAFKLREHVEKSLFESYGGEKGKVIGQIALWGRVLECTRGFRGEFAYPQTLQFVEVDKKTATEISECYGVPYSIIKHNDLKCDGYIVATEYDFDRLYATIKYQCGLEIRAEVSQNWEGKQNYDFGHTPPCPEHHH